MDQGLAAVWAGIAGLAGAAIGGGAAAWGAWIGGKRTVEAAEKQAQRAAVTEQQHWQRQARYDAYQAALLIAEQPVYWGGQVTRDAAEAFRQDMLRAIARIRIVGTVDVANSATPVLRMVITAASAVPPQQDLSWDDTDRREAARRFALLVEAARHVLEQLPT
jgi:hypothetical protein